MTSPIQGHQDDDRSKQDIAASMFLPSAKGNREYFFDGVSSGAGYAIESLRLIHQETTDKGRKVIVAPKFLQEAGGGKPLIVMI